MSARIPFDEINRLLLANADRLLATWFPGGRVVGHEFLVGSLDGDIGESFRVNLRTGEWAEFNGQGHRGTDMLGLYCAKFFGNADKAARVTGARKLGGELGVYLNGHSEGKPQSKPGKSKEEYWLPLTPQPDQPRPPDAMFATFNGGIWEYTDQDDRATHYVGRINKPDGGKDFGQVTFGDLNGQIGWHHKWPAKPYPLYGLNRLATMAPDAEIVLCEGEKSADAAQALFPDRACLAWFGGCNQAKNARIAPLQGRNVIVWADNDEGGHKAAEEMLALLQGVARTSRLLRVKDLPPKADAADVFPDDPEAWFRERLGPTARERIITRFGVEAWLTADIPPDDPFLGHLIVRGSRSFFCGSTGTGKTMFGLSVSFHIAEGVDFLHWAVPKPRVVMYFDGEMPRGLAQTRIKDERRRFLSATGRDRLEHPGSLIVVSAMAPDWLQELIGREDLPPLNTAEGKEAALRLIDAVQPDVVVFDNAMSLLDGVQKEEETWKLTMPLVMAVTRRGIAQAWFDHTGWDSSRQYGSSIKAWTFDLSGVLKPLSGEEAAGADLAMTLSFAPPGKARRRTPDNRADFEDCIIRLHQDQWTSEVGTASKAAEAAKRGKGRPMTDANQDFHDAVLQLAYTPDISWTVIEEGMPKVRAVPRKALRQHLVETDWFVEHVDYSEKSVGDFSELTTKGYQRENDALRTLMKKRLIGFNRGFVWPL